MLGTTLKLCLLLAVSVSWTEGKLNQYCAICKDHTMCQFEGPGQACEGLGKGGVSNEEKGLILDLHNWYRAKVATGAEDMGKGGPQPKAANMQKLVWDEELATVAQRWADQCTFQHDSCRHDTRFKVGQNLYWNWRFPIIDNVNWTAAVSDWYSEVAKFDPKIVNAYKFDPEVGHYTQMIWHDTRTVGCGLRAYGPNKLYVCNYGPTGNWLEQPIYHVGEPCSKCPKGTACVEGLCEGQPIKKLVSSVTKPVVKASKPAPIDRTVFDLLTASKPAVNSTGPFKLDPVITLKSGKPEIPDQQPEPGFVDFLTPPRIDAESVYEKIPLGSTYTPEETITTNTAFETQTEPQPPIDYNIIEDLETTDDEEIRKDIEELKLKIKRLISKIVAKRLAHAQ